ncbi:hypothetical protein [Parachlamydia acanthamoebae]|jgi:hypothetical protein|uniref:hypothetical protein n=1 Tax=Parachlamydia acanthamoebae TaxID=83552 RepID=UPI000750FD23|nr:hypothetical protein [Parachlamydia acanthamoebae]
MATPLSNVTEFLRLPPNQFYVKRKKNGSWKWENPHKVSMKWSLFQYFHNPFDKVAKYAKEDFKNACIAYIKENPDKEIEIQKQYALLARAIKSSLTPFKNPFRRKLTIKVRYRVLTNDIDEIKFRNLEIAIHYTPFSTLRKIYRKVRKVLPPFVIPESKHSRLTIQEHVKMMGKEEFQILCPKINPLKIYRAGYRDGLREGAEHASSSSEDENITEFFIEQEKSKSRKEEKENASIACTSWPFFQLWSFPSFQNPSKRNAEENPYNENDIQKQYTSLSHFLKFSHAFTQKAPRKSLTVKVRYRCLTNHIDEIKFRSLELAILYTPLSPISKIDRKIKEKLPAFVVPEPKKSISYTAEMTIQKYVEKVKKDKLQISFHKINPLKIYQAGFKDGFREGSYSTTSEFEEIESDDDF